MIDRMSAQSLMKSCSWTLRPAQFSTCIDIAEAIRAHRVGGRSVFDAWTALLNHAPRRSGPSYWRAVRI